MNLLLFDIHGTLINSEDYLKDYESQLTGFTTDYFSRKFVVNFDGYHGLTERNNLKDIFAKQGLDLSEKELDDFFNLSGNRYKNREGSLNLISKVKESLQTLSDKNLLGLVTGSQKLVALKCLESTGISKYFLFGAFGNESYDRFELVNLAIKRSIKQGWKGDNIYIIGDTERDIESGKKAKSSLRYNIKTIAVLTGSGKFEQLKLSNPDYIIKDLSEIEQIIIK
ncbi:MAG: HAD hydrolase-like protein [Nanoarchaeota archaeon]